MNIIDKIRNEISFNSISYIREGAINIAPALRMLLKKNDTSIIVFKNNDLISQFIADDKTFFSAFSHIKSSKILGRMLSPVYLFKCKDINRQYKAIKKILSDRDDINIIAIEGTGVFTWGETKAESDKRMALFLDLIKVKKYESLSNKIDFEQIERSLVQTYSNIKKEPEKEKKRLVEKIAVVTGAAQGFGKGIAEFLANEGANVILADLNIEIALKNALGLSKKYVQNKFLAVKADVANNDSVRNMIYDVVEQFGGIDIFISNAGVLKAGNLENIDLENFELSTKVNYTAFFLCCKYASIPMKIQFQFDNNYFSDIIQINSKSGLEGSKNNFAYAGSKFGGIGLTQSFALELVDYNIKVNAICPGNFFEGPLWSDPENGLFIQYLKAGKVPGAQTVDDIRKFYESKIPMKRGCKVKDVSKAILYVIDQKYETGQAIPVTGGQVMLR